MLAAYHGEDLHHAHNLKASLPVAHKMADLKVPPHWILALDEVRFVGDPVAIVVANSPYAARDAAELVQVEYEELPAVVDPFKAMAEGAPLVHKDLGTNVCFRMPFSTGDPDAAFAAADEVIKQRIVNQRVAPVPIEPRSMVANWDAGMQQLTLYSATQIPHLLRTQLAVVLGLPENHIRAIAPEVGGGFGAKLNVYAEEAVVSWVAMQLERPVKYIETRSECFQAMIHGRDQIDDLEIAATKDGTITGLRVQITANMGAYLQLLTPVVPTLTMLMIPGCYTITNISCEVVGVLTNTMSTDAYRGAGRPEATFFIERAMDLVAQRFGLDPAEVRRKNFIPNASFPHTTAMGLTYDSGDYETTMDKALRLADYPALRKQQEELRAQGPLHGHRALDLRRGLRHGPLGGDAGGGLGLGHDPGRADRQHHRDDRRLAARPGPGDDLRADRRRRARRADRPGQRDPRRHRQGAVRRRHVRLARHRGRRRGAQARDRHDPGQGDQDRRAPVGSQPRRRRVPRRQDPGQGRSRPRR